MANVTVSSAIPSDAYWVSASLVEGGKCSDHSRGTVVDAIEGADTGSELIFANVRPGDYVIIKTSTAQDGHTAGVSCEAVSIPRPPPPKRCEVKDWFENLPPPAPPALSHGFRCEVKDWF